MSRGASSLLLVLLLAGAAALPAGARGDLGDLEDEFKQAIQTATPATVTCVAWGEPAETASNSSGVLVSRDGHVLSDGDVGAVRRKADGGGWRIEYRDEIEVRVPDLERGGFQGYRAKVLSRVRGADTCLLAIDRPPPGGFEHHVVPWTSAHLAVGDFSFVVGNAFDLSKEAPPALTAGIVAALRPMGAEGEAGAGSVAFVYTSAAVNPGVNGGPAVDREGRLVGTVSTWLQPLPGEPYQFLGRIVPIDRIRAAHADAPGAAAVFPPPEAPRTRAKTAAGFERVLRHVARQAAGAVVSIEVERETPLATRSIGSQGLGDVARWQGPVSGVVVDAEGWIVTSLYNLTNVTPLVAPTLEVPPAMQVDAGLRAIRALRVHLPTGQTVPGKVVAHDGRLGIALVRAEAPPDGATGAGGAFRPLPVTTEEDFAPGRFVLALGNPFGAEAGQDPLTSFGVLSKVHADRLPRAWRGQWQTDAGVTDANCGGALVDLRGRLLGILQLWAPLRHGRNSGIGFVVPWPRIAEALARMKRGEDLPRGRLGIRLAQTETGGDGVLVEEATEGSPAAAAGLAAGDRIVEVDGVPIASLRELQMVLSYRWAGDAVSLVRVRDDDAERLVVTLEGRP